MLSRLWCVFPRGASVDLMFTERFAEMHSSCIHSWSHNLIDFFNDYLCYDVDYIPWSSRSCTVTVFQREPDTT